MDKGGIVQMAKLVAFYSRADENYFGGSMKYIQIGSKQNLTKKVNLYLGLWFYQHKNIWLKNLWEMKLQKKNF